MSAQPHSWLPAWLSQIGSSLVRWQGKRMQLLPNAFQISVQLHSQWYKKQAVAVLLTVGRVHATWARLMGDGVLVRKRFLADMITIVLGQDQLHQGLVTHVYHLLNTWSLRQGAGTATTRNDASIDAMGWRTMLYNSMTKAGRGASGQQYLEDRTLTCGLHGNYRSNHSAAGWIIQKFGLMSCTHKFKSQQDTGEFSINNYDWKSTTSLKSPFDAIVIGKSWTSLAYVKQDSWKRSLVKQLSSGHNFEKLVWHLGIP